MWSSFLGQIQQRIDDAADLLGDEEGEEVEIEEKSLHQYAPSQPQSELPGSSSVTQDSSNNKPLAANNAAVHGDAQGWEEEEDLDDVISSTTAATSLSAPPPVMTKSTEEPEASAQASNAIPTAAPDSALSRRTSSVTEEIHEGIQEREAGAEAFVDTSCSSCVSSQATPVPVPEVTAVAQLATPPALPTVGNSTALPPSAAAEEHGANSSILRDSADTPPLTSTAVSTSFVKGSTELEGNENSEKSEKAEEAEERAEPAEDVTAFVIQSASSPAKLTVGEQQSRPSGEAAPRCDETPSLPPSSKPVKDSSDVVQLLRFQQQLADEMETVASLQKENAVLKGRVSTVEDELSSANARLAKTAGSEEQISLLIEKLGKEKERHKAAASERSRLERHVQDLEEELEEYRVKEEGWIGGSEQQQQNEDAAQQRITQLEEEVRARESLTEDLNSKLRDIAHQNSVLLHQVEELKASYSTQLDTVRESSSDTVSHLRREIEQLRASLQSLSTEYDTRTAELERAVQQSSVRAYQAEARFSEVEFSSVNTLQDLRTELEDSQRSIATWKAEAQKMRNEYTELLDQYALLKRSRAAAEVDLLERLSAESATVAELRKGLRDSDARYQALQETLRTVQAESEDQRKTIMLLETANQTLKASTTDNFPHVQSETAVSSLTPTKGSSLETSFSASPFSSRPAGRAAAAAVPMNPFVNRERPVWSDTADRKTRERLEQEVLRQSTELERLRQEGSENAQWRSKFLQLQTEHDLLLQLYGKLEDNMNALKSKAAEAAPVPPPGTLVGSSAPSL
ncbi:hypothetical protein ABB37_07823 [Leptomonas pyrrhocoris]|uniref:TATA element modulatory factor 1 TATA binding domain-containing protein n=1 Tax=Leptomonas pyrrhocoris TaxID=157538 RepID=A0A0M9FV07_LEPPY|nr:hypothetical protein ABB37_07823 [Leptomonas pyrrhocoris]KPA76529.1 hypothetical protein ABB37_07823 [Leptomonas pyrrhocoris]|eukprot:XP_015654968.1 hypothetical protein ABB37_07823 [Leptomonas pyrrhocoris]